MKTTESNQIIGSRKEAVSLLINKISEEGLWDSMKAKDVPEEVVKHVITELDLGKDPSQVRREMGIKSQTSKEWQKISAAIKMGYRVNSTTYFHRMFSRNENVQAKLYALVDKFLEQDIDALKELDDDDKPWLRTYAKEITPMIDALNRLQQGVVKVGKDLGVFTDPASENKGGGGVTIVVKSNIMLPTPEDVIKERAKIVEAQVVGKKELP
jgi:hypothetical protein